MKRIDISVIDLFLDKIYTHIKYVYSENYSRKVWDHIRKGNLSKSNRIIYETYKQRYRSRYI